MHLSPVNCQGKPKNIGPKITPAIPKTKIGAMKASKVKMGCILAVVFKASCGAMTLEGINVNNYYSEN